MSHVAPPPVDPVPPRGPVLTPVFARHWSLKRYSRFNGRKHETIKRSVVGDIHSLCCPPTKLLGGL